MPSAVELLDADDEYICMFQCIETGSDEHLEIGTVLTRAVPGGDAEYEKLLKRAKDAFQKNQLKIEMDKIMIDDKC